jgi:predicted permease
MFWTRPETRRSEPKNPMNYTFSFWNDVRYSSRTLRKNPGFTAIAVLAIALGIGLNTGIFSVINGIALRPLPVPGSTRIVSLFQFNRGLQNTHVHESPNYFTWQEYQRYRDDNHVFSGLLAYDAFLSVTLGGDRPQQLMGQLASCNYFDVLNEPPVLGRSFSASDCAVVGDGRVVVLSHDFWRSKFASDPAIVGREIILNRQPFTVIGVAPPGFQGAEPFASLFWAPITVQPLLDRGFNMVTTENTFWLALLGRIKPHVSKDQVQADLAVIAGRIDQLSPPRKTSIQIQYATLLSTPEERTYVAAIGAVLLAAVGMVLLIACANVANLLLARATGRRKEIAIRLSVGASRGRLIRQLLTESLMIALLSGALGSLIALWSSGGLFKLIIAHLPRQFSLLTVDVGPDLRILGFSLALTLLTGIVFGLAPALQASRPDMNSALKDSGAGVQAGSGGFLRHTLVGTQVAVCMVLLIAAGLLLRGLYVAQTVDPGFRMQGIAGVSFDLQGQGYDDRRAALFQQNLLQRLAALPGVDAVAQAGAIPLSNDHSGSVFSLPGQPGEHGVEYNQVSPEYFALVGIPIVRGRNFTETETRAGAPVAILTESTARRLWANQDPVGKIIRWEGGGDLEVIGIARDAQVSHLAKSDETYVYLTAGPKEQMYLKVLVHGSTAQSIQAAIHSIDPDFVADVTRLEDNLDFWRMPSRIVAILAGSLGALGMLLACIGVYGVVSYAVSRRVREIGIRMTLGADAREVKSLILRQALWPVLIGALIGIAGCAAVSQILSGMLFGVSAHDPLSFVAVPLLLLSVALAASYIPARRATKVDPMVALRYE